MDMSKKRSDTCIIYLFENTSLGRKRKQLKVPAIFVAGNSKSLAANESLCFKKNIT